MLSDKEMDFEELLKAFSQQNDGEDLLMERDRLAETVARQQLEIDRNTAISLAYCAIPNKTRAAILKTEDRTDPQNVHEQYLSAIGKFLANIECVIYRASEKTDPNLMTMIELEKQFHTLALAAENENLLPYTQEGSGWKGKAAAHAIVATAADALIGNHEFTD